ncbi:Bifunctional polymyxin resistance protein ArnA [Pseudobythopirellula maris]|uniref:Bifunctional polymyxin resistance protein ArnA n=1 Tax=Pseudobythopirellula maris TaxID=2527991 RepID=A0A5C5ZIT6_9BACT|nr:methionyl-tRNA formyltransferase [Pseudobythopirellula maris]TWT87098.1 Bifunctional polymyxin resistance protein ArnA [Pseudobythopirellula maris]
MGGRSVTRPRIIAIGSNLESEIALEGLLAAGANVVALVTRPPGDCGGLSDYVDLHPLCERHGVATIGAIDINASETVHAIRDMAPDYLYTLGWSQIFRDEVLASPSRSVIGSHPSPLPLGRGRAPAPWTILEGREQSAVSLFRMDRGVDSGVLLLQRPFEVPAGAYVGELYRLIAENLRDAYLELHEMHRRGVSPPEIAQDENLATHRAKRIPADGWIDFSQPASDVERLVRAVSHPYPGAYAYHRDRRVTVWRADLSFAPSHCGRPGQVLITEPDRLLVAAADRPLWLSQLSVEGRPLRSDSLSVGSSFGYRVEDEIGSLRRQTAQLRQEIDELRSLLREGNAAA